MLCSVSMQIGFDICFGIHVELKVFERVEQAPVFSFLERREDARARDARKGEEASSPIRVFCSRGLKKRTKIIMKRLPRGLLKE